MPKLDNLNVLSIKRFRDSAITKPGPDLPGRRVASVCVRLVFRRPPQSKYVDHISYPAL